MESSLHTVLLYASIGVALLILYYGVHFGIHIRRAIVDGKSTKPFSQTPAHARKRILIIGDSTAYGTGALNPENSIAGRLARDFPDTAIINEAHNAMNMAQLVDKLKGLHHEHFDHTLIHIGGIDTLSCTQLNVLAEHMKAALYAARAITSGTIFLVSVNNVGTLPLMRFPFTHFYTRRSKCVTTTFAHVIAHTADTVHIPLYAERADDPLTRDPRTLFSHDGIHPSDAGYAYWYQKIRAAIAPSMT